VSLSKDQIAEPIQENLGYPKATSTRLVESILEIIKTTLANGEDVMLSGFGKFCVNEKAARRGRSPATGEALALPPRRVVTFRNGATEVRFPDGRTVFTDGSGNRHTWHADGAESWDLVSGNRVVSTPDGRRRYEWVTGSVRMQPPRVSSGTVPPKKSRTAS